MDDLILTRNAEWRAKQRGVPPSLIAAVHAYADIEMPVGYGRIAARLSNRALQRLRHDRGATFAERAKDVVLVLAGAVVVTVLHAHGAASRRYRRRRSRPPKPQAQ